MTVSMGKRYHRNPKDRPPPVIAPIRAPRSVRPGGPGPAHKPGPFLVYQLRILGYRCRPTRVNRPDSRWAMRPGSRLAPSAPRRFPPAGKNSVDLAPDPVAGFVATHAAHEQRVVASVLIP